MKPMGHKTGTGGPTGPKDRQHPHGQGDTTQTYHEIPPHTYQDSHYTTGPPIPSNRNDKKVYDVEKLQPSCTAGWDEMVQLL